MNFSQSWPWYVAGPLIGLTVPLLFYLGNKPLGISSSLRHLCAAVLPARIPFFQYSWKAEAWNLYFVSGILLSGVVLSFIPADPILVHEHLVAELSAYGIVPEGQLLPSEIFSIASLGTLRGWIILVGGGFLVGFGTRYAGGCTSGHTITGLSTLQWPSLIATLAFMVGGILSANFLLPFILRF